MTRNQFALAIRADEKWVENTARLLGLSLEYTPGQVTWLGLVRLFSHDLGLTLARSAALATEALEHSPATRELRLGASPLGHAAVTIDLARYHSTRNAALSAALNLGGARRRGRPAKRVARDSLSRARNYGIDVDALRIGLKDSPARRMERLEENAQFVAAMSRTEKPTAPGRRKRQTETPPMSFSSMLQGLQNERVRFVVIGGLAAAAHGSRRLTDDVDICYETNSQNLKSLSALLARWDACPRGIEQGQPFFMDERQFRVTPLMTLASTEGMIDVLDTVKGVGDYARCLSRSAEVEAFETRFRILDLPALIDAKRAAGRPRDLDHRPELEALLALNRNSSKV